MTGRFASVIWQFLSSTYLIKLEYLLAKDFCEALTFVHSERFGVLTLFSIHLTNHFNNFNFPFNGGYLTAGSNQVGVFITAFLCVNKSKLCLP